LSAVGSAGFALNKAIDSRPRVRAWSISPWTHDSGPTSNIGVGSFATDVFVFSLECRMEWNDQEPNQQESGRGQSGVIPVRP